MAKQLVLYEKFDVLNDSVLEAYKDSIQSLKERARQTLGKFKRIDGDLAGSSPPMNVYLQDKGLLPVGSRLIGRKELERAVSYDDSFLARNYLDFGLALMSAGDSYAPNDLLARILAEQLKQKGIEIGRGKLVPLTALTLLEDGNSQYGLVYNLNEQTEKEDIRDLEEFKWDFGPRREGLARAYFDGDWDWNSGNGYLDDSLEVGRVVVVSAKGTSQKFLETNLLNFRE